MPFRTEPRPVALSENILTCPGCGGDNLHHGAVTVNVRVTEDSPGTRTHIDEQTVTIRPAHDLDFDGRRDDLRIAFTCEHCEDVGELIITQHKGVTLLRWDR